MNDKEYTAEELKEEQALADWAESFQEKNIENIKNKENTFWVKISAWAVVIVVIATGIAITIGLIYF